MKIFISSTAYDLYDFREKIKQIIEQLGHECIAFESPTFPVIPNLHSHDQCIEAVKDADIVICIIDKRYGGRYHGNDSNQFSDIELEISGKTKSGKAKKYKRIIKKQDLSITWCELITAQKEGKLIFTFARKKLLDEKEIRRRNQFLTSFKPAYAEREEIFDLIDWITKNKKNNWITPFNSIVDFEQYFSKWLKEIEKYYFIPNTNVNLSLSNNTSTTISHIPVLFILEGESDRQFINIVLKKINSQLSARFVVTYGKYRMFSNTLDYVTSMGEIRHTFVLYDTDDDDLETINSQNEIIQKLLDKGNVSVYPIKPEIETWIKAGLKNKNITHQEIRKIDLEIEFSFEDAMKNDSQFNSFVTEVKKLEK